MERFFDITFSLLALLALSPILLPIAVVLKLTGEREIFFLQERIGKNKETFKLFKFATMLKNSPNMGTGTVTMRDDPRVLPVGKFLRKTKINELPQLLNIFFGHMSIIGPRPLTNETFNAYSLDAQRAISLVRPGLSGIGSIIFRREEDILHGEAASIDFYSKVIAPYKGSLEQWFVANRNLYIYFMCILVTAWAVIFPRTGIAWKVFIGIPTPPEELKLMLNFKK